MNYVKRDLKVKRTLALNPVGASQRGAARFTVSYKLVTPLAMACDALIIIATSDITAFLYHHYVLALSFAIKDYSALAAMIAALFIAVGKSQDLYETSELLSFKSQARQIALNWIIVFLFIASVGFALKVSALFSRGAVSAFLGLGLCALIGSRIAWRVLLADGAAVRRFTGRKVAFIAAPLANETGISETLLRHGLQLEQRFALPADISDKEEFRKVIDRAVSTIRGSEIEEIVVSDDLRHWPDLNDLLLNLRSLPLPISLIPTGPTVELFKLQPRMIGETVTIELQRGPLSLLERFVKRAIDLAISTAALICLLPLMLLTAVAIKLDSSGPVIFRQRRSGFNGRKFDIYKFRTMSVLENGDTVTQACRDDQRITRVGRWLRRTSIDELPQLFNVIQGNMSIVGPRPHAVAHDLHFEKLAGKYAYRHHVKPGITGWAQVNGHRGITPTAAEIEARTKFDLWYIENWSILLDLKIIAMTVIEVLRGENAY